MRPRRALAALALLAASCSRAPVEQRAVPLARAARALAVDWPAGCEPPRWRAREAEDLLAAPAEAPVALRRLRLGEHFERDERMAYLAPAGSTYRFSLDVPPRTELRLALGRSTHAAEPGAIRLAARIEAPGQEPVELLERELPADGAERWAPVSLDLERWAGSTVELLLESRGTIAADRCGESLGAWATPRLAPKSAKRSDERPNLIWISVDTLRADRLGSYGGPRPTSPELDRLAASGVRFDAAISQAPWTKPSHRSMLTGLYPLSRAGLQSPFIGSLFHEAGYRTFALTGAGQVDSNFGFDRGFEIYRLSDWIHDPEPMVEWVAGLADAPFFLFLHTYEAHEPYTHTEFADALPAGRLAGEFSKRINNQLPGGPTAEEKRYIEALYDGDIAYTDARLGRLFRELERRGWLESTVVIVTSDHGEQLWDHGTWGHGQSLHDHQIRVPLILHLPRRLGHATGRVESEQVELIDLYPTVLELAGVPLGHVVQGRSLVPLLAGKGPLPPRQAFAESTNIRSYEKRALRTPRFKFVLWEKRKAGESDAGRYELFDLRADPREQNDLYGRHPRQAERLRAEVLRRVQGADGSRDEEVPEGLDEELRKQLEALGYIGN